MKPIVLATTSPYKIALFERLGFPFETAAPGIDEVILSGVPPQDQALRLAQEKAEALRETYPDHIIIGADQILALGKRILTKPGSSERAVEQVLSLAGRTHCLHTAYALINPARNLVRARVVTSRMRVRSKLDRDQVRDMVLADQTTDCVGGYKWECSGVQLFSAIRTPDPNAIVGLPLVALGVDLRALLKE